MPDIEYRLYFNNTPATREQLDRVEEITVEQEIDMAWEARIKIPLRVDEKGNWTKEDEEFMKSFSRIRVEIKNGDSPFVPLIDGQIVGDECQKTSEPGQSLVTLLVHDDSMNLNREESITRFENMIDSEIARQVFTGVDNIASTDIDETSSPPGGLPPVVVQRGTKMQILRLLAKRHEMHVYVLPGESPGQSIGCFKSFPKQTDDLPPLTLLGHERNMESFNCRNDAQRPARVRASTLSILDKTVTTRESRFDIIELLGDEHAFENESSTYVRLLPPHQGESVDLDRRVNSDAQNSSYSYDANGTVFGSCYKGVLQPYRVVTVKGVDEKSSGNYDITRVTHTLNRSVYSQSFSLRRNARSSCGGVISSVPQGSMNLQAAFNFSRDII